MKSMTNPIDLKASPWSEFEDDIEQVISDTIDMDWAPRWGARAVVAWLDENALLGAAEASRHLALTARIAALEELVDRAEEELRLIRAKDCNAVYDTTLRVDFALSRQARALQTGEAGS